MKALWFTNTPANADEYFSNQIRGTGGWLKALNKELQKNISLHVTFYHTNDKSFRYQNTTYHPILIKRWLVKKVLKILGFPVVNNEDDLRQYLDIIDRVKPDVIHIHGTENSFGCIITHTKVPVVISIQGNISVYFHKFLDGYEKEYLFNYVTHLLPFNNMFTGVKYSTEYKRFKKMSAIERVNLSNVKYIIGRTNWDRRISSVLSPQSTYFHNDEILRKVFYESEWTMPEKSEIFILHTTSGIALYKGFETLCHSLKLLNDLGFKCEWRVAGICESDLIVRLTKHKLGYDFPEYGLTLLGNLTEEELVGNLLKSNLYIMPSHIENSPNSLCEALLLGMPCVSTYVGGTGSLIQDKINGLVVQSGDPWAMAGAILEIAENSLNAASLGKNARLAAIKRHNKGDIVEGLLKIYRYMLTGQN